MVVARRAWSSSNRRRPLRRGSLVLSVAVVLSFGLITDAAASNFGSTGTPGSGGTTNGVWLTNNANWVVARIGLTQQYTAGVNNAVVGHYNPTDLNGTLTTPSICSDASHDVCVFDGNFLNNGLRGWHACAGSVSGAHPNQICSVGWVRINTFYNPPAAFIACHELGHNVGLRHTGGTTADATSCMNDDGRDTTGLTAHDRTHINGRY